MLTVAQDKKIDDDIKDAITAVSKQFNAGFTVRNAVISVLVEHAPMTAAASHNGINVGVLRAWCRKIQTAYNNRDRGER